MKQEDIEKAWLENTNARIAETNRRIRSSGGNIYYDTQRMCHMVTVCDGPPVKWEFH
jgi:hypothetical protein